jgi:dTDP-4-amino-4,6-dideoxygalactose transaminase
MPKEDLAIFGGPKSVLKDPSEGWQVPLERIKDAVCGMIDDGIWSQSGSGLPLELERRFAEYIGSEHCLCQHNGTSTLWAAYYAVGVRRGDEVLHPCYTWICSIAPAVHMGARPVFCEIDPETLLIDPEDMERRITPRTRAVSVVHMYGHVCDMDRIMEIAEKHGIAVIEDASHCHGAEWDGRKAGSIGDVGCFSMQGGPPGGKPIPAGEAGFVVTDRRELYERILLFCHLNRGGVTEDFTNPDFMEMASTNLGLKFRTHPWATAAAMVLFDSLEYRNEKMLEYVMKIHDALEGIQGIDPVKIIPKSKPAGFYGGLHMLYRPGELGDLPVERLLEALEAEGLDMSHRGYGLTHRLKLFADGFDIYGDGGPLTGDYQGYPEGSLPISEEVHNRILGMPVFIEEPPGYSEQVIRGLRKVTENYESLL